MKRGAPHEGGEIDLQHVLARERRAATSSLFRDGSLSATVVTVC